jgi:predicted NUDIX family NTP pyrophosphohydrolase
MGVKRSAGLLMYRRREGAGVEVFLVHPGGPYFVHRDEGVWSIPKGLVETNESPMEVAAREFEEETGQSPRDCGLGDALVSLGTIEQKEGKIVEAWAFEGDWPAGVVVSSNRFELEWPPHSGRKSEFPEVDQGQFFDLQVARKKLLAAQVELLDRLVEHLDRE